MPTLDIEIYKIDFLILASNDPKTIVILDRSNYLDNPQKPLLDIILPGFTGGISVNYNLNGITVLDSDKLGLTESCEYNNLANLPDGVYQIKMKVCPYDELFSKKCHLKTQDLENKFDDLILSMDKFICKEHDNKIKESIIDIDILIKSAKAEIAYCNVQKGVFKYAAAYKRIEILQNKLNCL